MATTTQERGLRQTFRLKYHSRAGEAKWTATIERGELLSGSVEEGVFFYGGTGSWGPAKFIQMEVALPVPPIFARAHVNCGYWMELTGAARQLADARLLQDHPDALVEHSEIY